MRIMGWLAILFLPGNANAAEGLIEIKSDLSVKDTITRLEVAAKERGL
jgi:hypothetical protein